MMAINSNGDRACVLVFCIVFASLWQKAATLSTTTTRARVVLKMVGSCSSTMMQQSPWRKHRTPNDQHRLEDIFLGDEHPVSTVDETVFGFGNDNSLPQKAELKLAKLFKAVEKHDRSLEIDNQYLKVGLSSKIALHN